MSAAPRVIRQLSQNQLCSRPRQPRTQLQTRRFRNPTMDKIPCPFATDAGTLAFTGVVGAAHAAAMIIAPKKVNEKLLTDSAVPVMGRDDAALHANMRITGAMAGAAALTAIALAKKEDTAVIRRAALAAQGVGMLGVAAQQVHEVREERYRKRIGWAMAGVHGVLGATCLYRGLKEGMPK
ncbi:hypothetical protein Rsub_08920 [Raphidocelis subcapitata]|uniref:Uncharacterized protein n=1 Tax=Raphidocelis subcapitata TaxID=307507 RepID=A0A2V0PB58_9CHLO|nr:hypothetical protein Rsub_08920 [Raphidocelis subcapitata]|eukprot:GBF96172.1 hypothetical protein Rsub_08920 [Raphidocelis subcapitata]